HGYSSVNTGGKRVNFVLIITQSAA
ncbi:MAG: hypothetical protein QOE32_7923, partial [Pseudonocardiales bacterium]|nr:hypothetical protein [Pseudonocardiales bacterium]